MLKSIRRATVASLAFVLISAPARAETPSSGLGRVGAGDIELGFYGDFSKDDDAQKFKGGVALGRYWTDNVLIRLSQEVEYETNPNPFITSVAGYGAFVTLDYQMPTTGRLVPYLGAGGGFSVFRITSDFALVDGAQQTLSHVIAVAGLKYFITDRASIEYWLGYARPITGEYCDAECYDVYMSLRHSEIRFNVYY